MVDRVGEDEVSVVLTAVPSTGNTWNLDGGNNWRHLWVQLLLGNNSLLPLSSPHMTPQRWDLVWEGVSVIPGMGKEAGCDGVASQWVSARHPVEIVGRRFHVIWKAWIASPLYLSKLLVSRHS